MHTGREIVPTPKGASRIVVLSHVGFALIGVVNTMLGPILPYLFVRWRLNDSQGGLVLLAQPAAAMLASLAAGLLIKRFGFKTPLTIGFGLMAASAFGLGFGNLSVGVVCIAVSGLSLGLTVPATNLLISEANPRRRAAASNILNLIWGVGAATGPLLISAFVTAGGLTAALLFLAGWAAAMTLLVSRGANISPTATDMRTSATGGRANFGVYVLLTFVLVFVNVGVESATGGWIAIYVQRLGDAPAGASWSLAPSAFWAGLLVARAAAPFVLRRVSETKTTLAGIIVAVCGLSIVLSSRDVALVFGGIFTTGLGLGPVFPTTFALFTQRCGAAAAQLSGVLFLLAGLGAAVFPWVVGLVSVRFDGLRAGLLVPLCGGILMIVLQLAIMSSSPRTPAARPQY